MPSPKNKKARLPLFSSSWAWHCCLYTLLSSQNSFMGKALYMRLVTWKPQFWQGEKTASRRPDSSGASLKSSVKGKVPTVSYFYLRIKGRLFVSLIKSKQEVRSSAECSLSCADTAAGWPQWVTLHSAKQQNSVFNNKWATYSSKYHLGSFLNVAHIVFIQLVFAIFWLLLPSQAVRVTLW